VVSQVYYCLCKSVIPSELFCRSCKSIKAGYLGRISPEIALPAVANLPTMDGGAASGTTQRSWERRRLEARQEKAPQKTPEKTLVRRCCARVICNVIDEVNCGQRATPCITGTAVEKRARLAVPMPPYIRDCRKLGFGEGQNPKIRLFRSWRLWDRTGLACCTTLPKSVIQ
jgi:hypothetical protein